MSDPKEIREEQCESCVWYDTDLYTGDPICTADMDEDERLSVKQRTAARGCPYYRFYHEYKSVQKQN